MGKILSFVIEEQQESLLCWAAVAVSVGRFYDPSYSLNQSELAITVFGEKQYNQVCDPRKALDQNDNIRKFIERPLTLAEITKELRNGNPVAACMKFFIGWHLVIIYGIDEAGRLLIADPLHGKNAVSLESFTTSYDEYYSWTHSCLLKPSGLKKSF